ncbi:hypothetical protein AzCIB_1638 [Azoarcus sp. CIB]|uniref:hypothetical protein n=1 Tax=Aromatoleum sp. (strain CIB) TaxID=198107 RepID=UPI0006A2AF9D|nr:hypothetical protein [Azoarcus sp. CIB]AKU11539.1 hypothetical protein AzCIB_1638 [Azoarcus sp. CIB]
MQLKSIIPSGPEILREAVIVLAGALLATVVIRMLPATAKQWFTFPTTTTTTQ